MDHLTQLFLLLISAATTVVIATSTAFIHLFSVTRVVSLIYMQHLFYSLLLHTPPMDHLALLLQFLVPFLTV